MPASRFYWASAGHYEIFGLSIVAPSDLEALETSWVDDIAAIEYGEQKRGERRAEGTGKANGYVPPLGPSLPQPREGLST